VIRIGSIGAITKRPICNILEGLKLLIGADNPIGPNNHIHFPVVITYWHFAIYDLLSEG
jgi:hypothetical protein